LFNVRWLGSKIGNVHCFFGHQHPTKISFWVGMYWCTPEKFGKGRFERFYSDVMQSMAVPAADTSGPCVADADRVFQNGFEHRLQICRRATNNSKDLGRSRLLLQCLG